jgi:hypothetical protein
VTGPAAEHVKFAEGVLGLSNVPLGALHAYVIEPAPAPGPVADPDNATEEPTLVSAGLADKELTEAQL